MNTGKSTMCNSITQTFNPNEVDVKICETRNTATTDTNYRLFVWHHFGKQQDILPGEGRGIKRVYEKFVKE